MAYDETFQTLPRFTKLELYQIPEVADGGLRPLENIISLRPPLTSPEIQNWMSFRFSAGEVVVPRVVYDIALPNGPHAVAWVRRTGSKSDKSSDYHQIVCDCVAEGQIDTADFEEGLFACQAVGLAMRLRASLVRHRLENDAFLPRRHSNYITIKGMVQFILAYSDKHPQTWLLGHRSGVSSVGILGEFFRQSPSKIQKITQQMADEGIIALRGRNSQLVTLPTDRVKAA